MGLNVQRDWDAAAAILSDTTLQGTLTFRVNANEYEVARQASVEVTGHHFANVLGNFVRPSGVSHSGGAYEGGRVHSHNVPSGTAVNQI